MSHMLASIPDAGNPQATEASKSKYPPAKPGAL